MNILMIAPEPYFEPRGTPFSEYYRIKALCALGHTVDFVTYPIGTDRLVPGLTIIRAPRVFGIRSVKTGPSFKKVLLDIALFARVLARVIGRKYDLVHTHEEGSIMGVVVSKFKKIPHLYDMHSSLVQQMDNFQFSRSRFLRAVFRWVEKRSLRNARSVIVICRSLLDYAATITGRGKLTVIENFLDETPEAIDGTRVAALRRQLGPAETRLVLYTGTFEAYQGIPLLIEAMAELGAEYRLVLVGGTDRQVEEVQLLASEKGVGEKVVLVGQKPPQEIPYYLKAADILVSPRTRGTNIPLKVYSYLKSGVPVVATNLYTHTQTLTPEIAILAEPDARSFAAGICRAAGPEGREVAARASEFCRQNFSEERYSQLVSQALEKAIR